MPELEEKFSSCIANYAGVKSILTASRPLRYIEWEDMISEASKMFDKVGIDTDIDAKCVDIVNSKGGALGLIPALYPWNGVKVLDSPCTIEWT